MNQQPQPSAAPAQPARDKEDPIAKLQHQANIYQQRFVGGQDPQQAPGYAASLNPQGSPLINNQQVAQPKADMQQTTNIPTTNNQQPATNSQPQYQGQLSSVPQAGVIPPAQQEPAYQPQQATPDQASYQMLLDAQNRLIQENQMRAQGIEPQQVTQQQQAGGSLQPAEQATVDGSEINANNQPASSSDEQQSTNNDQQTTNLVDISKLSPEEKMRLANQLQQESQPQIPYVGTRLDKFIDRLRSNPLILIGLVGVSIVTFIVMMIL